MVFNQKILVEYAFSCTCTKANISTGLSLTEKNNPNKENFACRNWVDLTGEA
jgi:hypothetical protein